VLLFSGGRDDPSLYFKLECTVFLILCLISRRAAFHNECVHVSNPYFCEYFDTVSVVTGMKWHVVPHLHCFLMFCITISSHLPCALHSCLMGW
jgi:hypothetical protein